VCARLWLASADRRRRQRSCADEPVHGSTGSLLNGMSTFYIPQVAAVHTTAGGTHTKAQRRPQKFLDVGPCPILTLSGPALADWGHHNPRTGRASAFETALVSLKWNAHSRERHADVSRSTHSPKSAGHDIAGDHSTGMRASPPMEPTVQPNGHVCTTCGAVTGSPNAEQKLSRSRLKLGLVSTSLAVGLFCGMPVFPQMHYRESL